MSEKKNMFIILIYLLYARLAQLEEKENLNTPTMSENKRYCLYILKSSNKPKIIEVRYGETVKTIPLEKDNFMLFDTSEKIEIKLKGNDENIQIDVSNGIHELDLGVPCLLLSADEFVNKFINDLNESRIMGHRGSGQKNIYQTKEMFEKNPGDKELYFENTIASFNKAWENGAKWVELDVQLSKNKVPVIFHDFILKIEEKNLGIAELNSSEFLNFFGDLKVDSHALPTSLGSIFSEVHQEMGFNLEIKYPGKEEIEKNNLKGIFPIDIYIEEILSILSVQHPRRICFSSFHPLVVLYLRIRLPTSKIMFIIHHHGIHSEETKHVTSIENAISFCSKAGLDGLVMDFKFIKDRPLEVSRTCQENNLKLFIYGKEVSEKDNVMNLLEKGVDGIITDDIIKAFQ